MTQVELIKDWQVRAKRKTNAHTIAANNSKFCQRAIGVPSVILSAITGTVVFAELSADASGKYKLLVVAIVVLAAILTALQTFFKFGEEAELHKVTAAIFSKIRRKTDLALSEICKTPPNQQKIDSLITEIEDRFNDTIDTAPLITKRVWKNVEEKYPLN